jgi:hypothetical protein
MQMSACILLFVKAPRPGTVKSRLARTIGQEHATRLYENFVWDLLELLQTLPIKSFIFYAPADEADFVRNWLGQEHSCHGQEGEELGARMANAFRKVFHLGYKKAMIIGSDSPDLPSDYLQEALTALQEQNVVIGPAKDGGYYTLGFTQQGFLPEVFQDICWSTQTVLANTLDILEQHQKIAHKLPLWYDVDTLDDLRLFYLRNQQLNPDSHTMQYLIQHQNEIFPARAT